MSCNTVTDSSLSRRLGFLFVTLILAGALETGCSCQPNGQLRKWERAILGRHEPTNLRKPASANGDVCLKNQFSAAALKEGVRQLEARTGTSPIKGVWNNLDLSKIPRAQAGYLKSHSQWVENQGYDATGCLDLLCVLNRIYGSTSEEEGLLIYDWYLRMGSVLSVANRLPTIPVGSWRLDRDPGITTFHGAISRDYLFSKEELIGFGVLSRTLSPLYRNMTSLQSLHRVPRGFEYTNWPGSCGLAWGARSKGYIHLLDGCLTFDGDPKKVFGGFFYLGVSHEMSHRLDSLLGQDDREFSEQDEWLALSGWTHEESVDPRTGTPTLKWRFDPAKEGFVRDYAASSPKEDWADTAAHFRYEPETALEKSPNKSSLISKRLYNGRTFDLVGLLSYYLDEVRKEVSQVLPAIVDACAVGDMPVGSATRSGLDLQFHFSVDSKIKDCLSSRLATLIAATVDALKKHEYEACDFFSNDFSGFAKQLVERITPDLEALLSKHSAIADQLKALARLRADIKDGMDSREIFLRCFNPKNSQEATYSCYLTAMMEFFSELTKPYVSALSTEALETEKRAFLAANAMESARAETAKLFGDLFAGVEPKVRRFATKRWETCRSAPDSGQSLPKTRPFSGGERFVAAGILDCINTAIESDLDSIREAFSIKVGITVSDPHAQVFVRQLWLPLYMEVLNRLEQEEATEEEARREQLRSGAVSFIYRQLTDGRVAPGAACLERAGRIFDDYSNGLPADQAIPVRFMALEDIRRQWSAEACTNLPRKAPKAPVTRKKRR